DGTLFWIVRTDALNALVEPDTRANNTSAPTATLIAAPFVDLAVEAVSAPTAALSGSPIDVAWRVRNNGDTPGTGAWHDRVFLSQDGVVDAADPVLGTIDTQRPAGRGRRLHGARDAQPALRADRHVARARESRQRRGAVRGRPHGQQHRGR